MKRPILRNLFSLPYLPVVIAPWILLSPVIFTGKAVYWGTPYLQFLPWRAWALKTLLDGNLPLWTSLLGMGAPLAANYQSALFYPPTWLLWFLQLIGGIEAHAWGQAVLMAFHLTWAGVGMVWLTRELGFTRVSQAVSALAFSLSGYLVARAGFLSINASAAWMPWIIWSVQRVLHGYQVNDPVITFRKTAGLWLPFIVCAALQLLAGHAQTTWYTLLFAGLWVLWAITQNKNRSHIKPLIIGFVAALVAAVALAAIQLIPTAEYLLQSQRSSAVGYDFAMNYSLDPWNLITFIVPWIFGNPAHDDYWLKIYYWETAVYIGLFPFLLAVFAVIKSVFTRKTKVPSESSGTPVTNRYRSLVHFLLIITIVSMAFALGKNTPIFPFLYRYVPTFDMFQAPARFAIWAVFALSVLAGIGLETWRQPEGKGLYWARLLTAGAFAITLGSGLTWYVMSGVRMTFIIAAAVAGLWALGIGILTLVAPKMDDPVGRSWWKWAVAGWICIDLLVSSWGLNPAISLDLYSDTASNLESLYREADGHRVYLSIDDEDLLKYEKYFPVETFNEKEEAESLSEVNLPNANLLAGISMVNNYDPLIPERYSRWVEYVDSLSDVKRTPWLKLMDVSIVETVASSVENDVRYDEVEGSERFYWSNCAEYASDEEAAWEAVRSKLSSSLADETVPGGWAVIEGVDQTGQTQCVTDEMASIIIQEEDADRVVIQVESRQAGWLIQADVWYPGWRAYLDGEPTSLNRANYLFRGVSVPEGTHTIEIVYRPVAFYAGAAITIISIVALLSYFQIKWWYKKTD